MYLWQIKYRYSYVSKDGSNGHSERGGFIATKHHKLEHAIKAIEKSLLDMDEVKSIEDITWLQVLDHGLIPSHE
jgi:hypothetical protein